MASKLLVRVAVTARIGVECAPSELRPVLMRRTGEQTALEFIVAVERGIRRISRSPRLGSLRFAYELSIPDLRAWPISRFPHVVFYVDAQGVIDVWRILHTRRDIPTSLEPPET